MSKVNVRIGAGGVIALVAVVAVGYAVYKGKQAAETLVTETINPANSNNVVNHNFEKLYRWATGSSGTPGSDLYDLLH